VALIALGRVQDGVQLLDKEGFLHWTSRLCGGGLSESRGYGDAQEEAEPPQSRPSTSHRASHGEIGMVSPGIVTSSGGRRQESLATLFLPLSNILTGRLVDFVELTGLEASEHLRLA
jgi:hypothetical protein